MSRAMNVSLAEGDVAALCKTAKVDISAIEVLPSGGTHLVCRTGEGADEMRVKMKKHIIEGRVRRFPFYNPRAPW